MASNPQRRFWDRAARIVVSIGGLGIICAILLIFIYLVYEVLPLFGGAEISEGDYFPETLPGSAQLLEVDAASGAAFRLDDQGRAAFYDFAGGEPLAGESLAAAAGAGLTAVAEDAAGTGLFAAGFADGGVLVAGWNASPEPGTGAVSPRLEFPFGREPFRLLSDEPVRALALRTGQGRIAIAAVGASGRPVLLEEDADLNPAAFVAAPRPAAASVRRELPIDAANADTILLTEDPRWMFLVSASGELSLVQFGPETGASVVDTVALAAAPVRLTDVRLLAGGMSLLAADSGGGVGQWLIVREGDSARLRQVRRFELFDSAVAAIDVEQGRRNFVAIGEQGELALVNATAEAESLRRGPGGAVPSGVRGAALAPAGDALLLEDEQGRLSLWRLDNRHAEFSLSALWSRTWYENYTEPALVWQTTAADDAFEPKYSLAPLTFGTLKAALYAMIFAAPLAVCAAVYTGYFMSPGMRRQIKPVIELMEALPTVVIGFLAGLWLAPLVDANLAALALGIFLLPISVVLASIAMARLPERFESGLKEGWQLPVLFPVLLLASWLAWLLAPPLESWLFDGSLRDWLSLRWGLDYVSRNAMIVGVAMGFAVIPAIYSIADDAIFTVPRHLSYGALALGANGWQTMAWLILPAAAPGILSALMIGFGRALGETMIVLMATGNTPIMDMNLFEGMRTLAANLAIEIPESEVGSTHYRILFLASLVLLLFTFAINTIAELVRQRLRKRYRTI
ncbi:MAG: ABC transporter permease subunit [Gammaproteobacteria bacterium]|nr:ABC transporter permease subunit [Gammaproteobacteria bacterium]